MSRGNSGGASRRGVQKRRAVPPGFLQHLHHAQRQMHASGLSSSLSMRGASARPVGVGVGSRTNPPARPAASTSSTTSGSTVSSCATSTAAPTAGASAAVAYIPVKTLPLLFAQRKRFLARHKHKAGHADAYHSRPGQTVSLAA